MTVALGCVCACLSRDRLGWIEVDNQPRLVISHPPSDVNSAWRQSFIIHFRAISYTVTCHVRVTNDSRPLTSSRLSEEKSRLVGSDRLIGRLRLSHSIIIDRASCRTTPVSICSIFFLFFLFLVRLVDGVTWGVVMPPSGELLCYCVRVWV